MGKTKILFDKNGKEVKLKKDGTPKRSGGDRPGAGRKRGTYNGGGVKKTYININNIPEDDLGLIGGKSEAARMAKDFLMSKIRKCK